MPMCKRCKTTLGNDSLKPGFLTQHLQRAHPESKDEEWFRLHLIKNNHTPCDHCVTHSFHTKLKLLII